MLSGQMVINDEILEYFCLHNFYGGTYFHGQLFQSIPEDIFTKMHVAMQGI